MSPAVLFTAVCRMCGKPRNPAEFVGNRPIGMCWNCLEWHAHAIEVLAGKAPRGCQDCGKSHQELEILTGHGDVTYRLHRKDGVYQILGVVCGCSDRYERKRRDMYGATPYGHQKKLN